MIGWIAIAVVALLVLWVFVIYRRAPVNIEASGAEAVTWSCGPGDGQLQALFNYVVKQAYDSIGWYWKKKTWKARLSRAIQWIAIVLTATAGLLPVAGQLFVTYTHRSGSILQSGLVSSVLVGSAAALLGLDKAFGFSTGWARYVLAATDIRRLLETFRMEWMILVNTSCPPPGSNAQPSPELVSALLTKARDFRVAVENVVVQETKDWVTEFQNNMAQLEKDVKTQVETLKAQVDKTIAATQTGWLELTVANAPTLRGSTFAVTLEAEDGSVVAQESVANSKSWVKLNLRPGTYRLSVSGATSTGSSVSTQFAVVVKPGQGTRPADVTLA